MVFGEDIIDHKYVGDEILNMILPSHYYDFQIKAEDWLKFYLSIEGQKGSTILSDYIEAVFKETANPHCILYNIYIIIDMLDITGDMTIEQNKKFLDILYDFIMNFVNEIYPTKSANKIQLSVNDLYVNGYIDPFLIYYQDVMEITDIEYILIYIIY